jgi:hypothetical protein
MNDFSGHWFTTYGPMNLTQSGSRVQGTYGPAGMDNAIEGTVKDGTFHFRYREPDAQGEGWFVLERYGKFAGQWRPDGMEPWGTWTGQRGFDGIWDSSFGPLRLIQEQGRVHGSYEGLGSSTIDGRVEGDRLTFRYQEPAAQGEGAFELAEDGGHFQGEWRPDGAAQWGPWKGRRLMPQPGLVWLVVLEAYWQRGLHENEYAFGNMLREFFARVPNIVVRHRFFNNEAGLAKWCRELLYIPEPVTLVLATHGDARGLSAQGEPIGPAPLVNGLRQADNITVLHFSSCLMLEDGKAGDFTRVLRQQLPFPISGYAASVDWAASALIEFTYLDMILARGLQPDAAAEQVKQLIAFAGDTGSPNSPYPPAQFRFWSPGTASPRFRVGRG